MTLKELLKETNWDLIKSELINQYPEVSKNIDGYENAFRRLESMKVVESQLILKVSEHLDLLYSDLSIFVNALKKEGVDKVGAGNAKDLYVFRPISWEEWLGMEIESTTSRNFTPAEIIACFLYEMTNLDEV